MFHKKCKRLVETCEREWAELEKRNQKLETLLADIAEVFPAVKQTNAQKMQILGWCWSLPERTLELHYRAAELHTAAEHIRNQAKADKVAADEAVAQNILDDFRAPKKK